ncbi:MAG: hypothetical protein SPK32_09640 [Bacteroidaceae bacterium]|nr:hypothetical protein [Bacteroidaceae bacterium]
MNYPKGLRGSGRREGDGGQKGVCGFRLGANLANSFYMMDSPDEKSLIRYRRAA